MKPNPTQITRRSLLKSAGAIAIGLSLPHGVEALAEKARNSVDVEDRFAIKFHTIGGDGKAIPAPKDVLKRLYLVDKEYDPIKLLPEVESDGVCMLARPKGRFAFAMPFDLPGFGDVWTYGDDGGPGFESAHFSGTIDLNYALAASRLKKVEAAITAGESDGCGFPSAVVERLGKSRALLKQSREAKDPAAAAELATDSLTNSMWAGETVAVERARHRIKKNGPRPDFLFGCNAFGCLRGRSAYTKRFYDIFNYCTLPFYWNGFEPEDGKPQWERLDKMVEWCQAGRITPKGHPLVWFHKDVMPAWAREMNYQAMMERLRKRVRDIVSRYAGRIDIWDVINEAHNWANMFNYTYDQLDEMTKMACDETKAANPKATRLVNNTFMFGEDAFPSANGKSPERWTRTVHQYIQDLLRMGTDFEAIGMQLYWPGRDMLEMDALLDRFARFKKPIHITEQGISSNVGVDEKSMVKNAFGRWHKPWSEEVQADWVEQFWTIAYSKPAVRGLTWWDFSDNGHFWAFGGLLREDLTPKESYWRLRGLIQDWRRMRA